MHEHRQLPISHEVSLTEAHRQIVRIVVVTMGIVALGMLLVLSRSLILHPQQAGGGPILIVLVIAFITTCAWTFVRLNEVHLARLVIPLALTLALLQIGAALIFEGAAPSAVPLMAIVVLLTSLSGNRRLTITMAGAAAIIGVILVTIPTIPA
jgi:hypothetical protein